MAVGPTSGEIRQAQEAMVRQPNAAPVIQGVVEDLGAAGVQAGLERAAMRQPSFTAINNLRENNFGHIDAQGNRQYHGNEQALNQQAQARIDMIRSLIDQGFNAMQPAQRNQILAEVSQAILQTPEMRTRFANLNLGQATAEADRMARDYLMDPNFRGVIIDLLMQRTDLTRPIADNVSETAHKLEEATAERNRLTQANTGDLAKADAEVANATTRLRQYQEDPNPPPNGGQPNNGRFYTELNTQITARDTARTNITTLETNTIPNHETTISQLETEERSVLSIIGNYEPRKHPDPGYVPANPPIPNDPAQYMTPDAYIASLGMRSLNVIRGALQNEQTQLRTARQNLATEKSNQTSAESRITQINEEKTRAENALKEAQASRDKIQNRINDLNKEINSNNAKFLKDQGDRERQQTAWVSELDNIIRDATSARVHEEMPIAVQKLKDRLTEDTKNRKDNTEKQVLNTLTRRYFNGENQPQRNVIDADYNILMRTGAEFAFQIPDANAQGGFRTERLFLDGSEQALARVLGWAQGNTPQEQERIYNIMRNQEFRNEMAPRVAQEILTARLFTGKLSRNEVLAIERSTWGPGMVAKALEGKTNLQAAVDKLVGKGVLNWGDNLAEQLKKIEWSKFAMILLILTGVIGGISLLKKG